MPHRVSLLGFEVDPLVMSEAVEQIYAWVRGGRKACRYVVTPNVDHAVLFQEHEGLQRAYDNASLILADGAPLVAAARLLGVPLPGRVTGSDLAPALFSAAERQGGLKVYLLGAGPGVAERAAARIEKRWPQVKVVGCYSPPLGFERDRMENDKILAKISEAAPDILVVGLGAPKQELWVNAHRTRIRASATLCIGAAIDFLAGEKRRAPRWMQRLGLEWIHRLVTEPRRLAHRYARDAWIFPQLVARAWVAGFRRTQGREASQQG